MRGYLLVVLVASVTLVACDKDCVKFSVTDFIGTWNYHLGGGQSYQIDEVSATRIRIDDNFFADFEECGDFTVDEQSYVDGMSGDTVLVSGSGRLYEQEFYSQGQLNRVELRIEMNLTYNSNGQIEIDTDLYKKL